MQEATAVETRADLSVARGVDEGLRLGVVEAEGNPGAQALHVVRVVAGELVDGEGRELGGDVRLQNNAGLDALGQRRVELVGDRVVLHGGRVQEEALLLDGLDDEGMGEVDNGALGLCLEPVETRGHERQE